MTLNECLHAKLCNSQTVTGPDFSRYSPIGQSRSNGALALTLPGIHLYDGRIRVILDGRRSSFIGRVDYKKTSSDQAYILSRQTGTPINTIVLCCLTDILLIETDALQNHTVHWFFTCAVGL